MIVNGFLRVRSPGRHTRWIQLSEVLMFEDGRPAGAIDGTVAAACVGGTYLALDAEQWAEVKRQLGFDAA